MTLTGRVHSTTSSSRRHADDLRREVRFWGKLWLPRTGEEEPISCGRQWEIFFRRHFSWALKGANSRAKRGVFCFSGDTSSETARRRCQTPKSSRRVEEEKKDWVPQFKGRNKKKNHARRVHLIVYQKPGAQVRQKKKIRGS